MPIKIHLDAGHYGKVNKSPVNKNYTEAERMWKLHLLLKKRLEEYGFIVTQTRVDQKKDMPVYDRGLSAKGCDLFISLHSNAVSGSKNEYVDYPVVFVPISGKVNALGKLFAECIAKVMGTNQKAQCKSKKLDGKYDYYGVIRGSAAVGVPGILPEHSFHTNKRIANWLMDDKNLETLAKAEADVIANYYGVKKVEKVTENKDAIYTIQIGAFNEKSNAEAKLKEAKDAGFKDAFIVVNADKLKSVDEIAKEVINGKWGSGAERKKRLEEAGYSYDEVQSKVNELLM